MSADRVGQGPDHVDRSPLFWAIEGRITRFLFEAGLHPHQQGHRFIRDLLDLIADAAPEPHSAEARLLVRATLVWSHQAGREVAEAMGMDPRVAEDPTMSPRFGMRWPGGELPPWRDCADAMLRAAVHSGAVAAHHAEAAELSHDRDDADGEPSALVAVALLAPPDDHDPPSPTEPFVDSLTQAPAAPPDLAGAAA